MQKNIGFLLLSTLLLASIFSATQVMATTATPSASPVATSTPATDNQVTEILKERLKATLGNSTTSASPTATEQTFRIVIGVIKDVIQKTLIVETKDGKRQVVVDDDTILLRNPGNQPIKLENIRIDDYLIAMGTFKGENILETRRLIASTTPLFVTNKISGYGQITEIKNSSLTLTSSGDDQIVLINSKTLIKSKDKDDLSIKDLTLNSRVIYTAEKAEGATTATVLMLVK